MMAKARQATPEIMIPIMLAIVIMGWEPMRGPTVARAGRLSRQEISDQGAIETKE